MEQLVGASSMGPGAVQDLICFSGTAGRLWCSEIKAMSFLFTSCLSTGESGLCLSWFLPRHPPDSAQPDRERMALSLHSQEEGAPQVLPHHRRSHKARDRNRIETFRVQGKRIFQNQPESLDTETTTLLSRTLAHSVTLGVMD